MTILSGDTDHIIALIHPQALTAPESPDTGADPGEDAESVPLPPGSSIVTLRRSGPAGPGREPIPEAPGAPAPEQRCTNKEGIQKRSMNDE